MSVASRRVASRRAVSPATPLTFGIADRFSGTPTPSDPSVHDVRSAAGHPFAVIVVLRWFATF